MQRLNRRKFVQAASLTLTGLAARDGAARDISKTYRACVIGHTGRGGYGHDLDTCFQKLPNVAVVGLADPDEQGRAATARKIGAARVYADCRQMLDKERPNLVAICPYYVERRLEMTQAAAEVDAHIYMDKPMAVSLEEADAMVAAAEKHQVKMALAHQVRLVPQVLHLKKLVEDGLIGDLLEVRARGKEDRRAGGEDLIVCGWHCHYLMRYFAGEPLWCSARVTQEGREITVEDRRPGTAPVGPVAGDCVHASWAFPRGVQGHFASQKNRRGQGSDFQVVLYGSKGAAQIHISAEPKIYYLPDPLWSPGRSGASWQHLPGAPPNRDSSGLTGTGACNKWLVEDLIRAAETGGQSVASGDEGRATLEMIMSVYASHLRGARVQLPLRERKHPLGSLS
jgi:predicted dehydrogenase